MACRQRIILPVCCLIALACGFRAQAAEPVTLPQAVSNVAIAPGALDSALEAVHKQTGLQIVYVSAITKGKKSNGAPAGLPIAQTLARLLDGTGLEFRWLDGKTVQVSAPGAAPVTGWNGAISSAAPEMNLARAETSSTTAEAARENRGGEAGQNDPDANRSDAASEVLVTGSRIKGVKDQFSPVISVTREEMDLAGYRTVSDFFENLPQNFGGGVSPDTVVANSASGAGAASINLRGLGNEATLILLNGRRLPAGGALAASAGSFVDISAIPISAIERIEVVTDGASAIYGSEAIAGVVNIITRKDFRGAESRLTFSTITDGGADTIKVGQTFGLGGPRAHGLVSYEYSHEDPLDTADKRFAAGAATNPTWFLPSSRKHSVSASGGVELSPRLSASLDGYFNKRDSESFNTRGPPSPLEASGPNDVEQFGGATALHLDMARGWEGDASVSYSKSDFAADLYFITLAQHDYGQTRATNLLGEVSMGGPLFRLTDDPVKLVVGMQHRHDAVYSLYSTAGAAPSITEEERNVLAAYGEIYAPLLKQVAMTLAARYEDYSDVGSSFDPKAGISWTPLHGLNLRSTYQTSFRAPRLRSIEDIYGASLLRYSGPGQPAGGSVALLLTGTRSNLHPEQGENWSFGFDFTPERVPGLHLRGTYFSIDYTERMGSPSLGVFDTTRGYLSFAGDPIQNPDPELVQSLIARARAIVDYSTYYPTLGTLTPAGVTVVLDARQQNLSSSKVAGMDFEAGYELPLPSGSWLFSVNATLLDTYNQQTTASTPVDDLLNTYANPVDLRLRGKAAWRRASLTAQLAVNYVDHYRDDEATGGVFPIASWTTLDATVRLDLGALSRSNLARGAFLSFNVDNLFNTDPPRPGPRLISGATSLFDAANADPVGRRAGLLLTKQW